MVATETGMVYARKVINNEKALQMVKVSEKTDNVEIVGMDFKAATEKGGNFSSDVIAVDIDAMVNGIQKTLHWVIKLPPPEVNRAVMFRETYCGYKEFKFYSELLPNFRALIAEKGADVQLDFCHSPYNEHTEDGDQCTNIIALENLKYLGFDDAVNKKKGLSLEYCQLVVKALAKMHAVSYAFFKPKQNADSKFDDEETLILTRDFIFSEPNDKMLQMFEHGLAGMELVQDTFIKNSQDLDLDKDKDFVVAFQNFIKSKGNKDRFEMMRDMMKESPSGMKVLCHGDPWFNNMLFRHDDDKRPIEICLLDNAIFKWCNPAVDLNYFFFSSTVEDFRKKHLNALLELYHTTFSEVLDKLGLDPDVYSLESVKNDFDYFTPCGFVLSLFILPTVLARPEDAMAPQDMNFDISDPVAMKKGMELFMSKSKKAFDNEPHLKIAIRGNFMQVAERGYFKIA